MEKFRRKKLDPFNDVLVITTCNFHDERGFFSEHYNKKEIEMLTGTSAPLIGGLSHESFDAQTGFKVLGNSELPGNALTSGHVIEHIGLSTGNDITDNYITNHLSNPSQARNGLDHQVSTKFILNVNAEKFSEDISTNNTASGSIVGSVERSEAIIDRGKNGDFNFIQIGVTGTL